MCPRIVCIAIVTMTTGMQWGTTAKHHVGYDGALSHPIGWAAGNRLNFCL